MSLEPNDPTQSGTSLPQIGAGDVQLSRNEVEALCTKAARGGGMAWGLAEEAGVAAGWLTGIGLDAPAALLARLRGAEGREWTRMCPVVARGAWQPRADTPLCPIAVGSAICDFAGTPDGLRADQPLKIGPVSQPVLVLPFLADTAQRLGCDIRLRWETGEVGIFASGALSGDPAGLEALSCATLRLSCDALSGGPISRPGGVKSRRDTLAALNALAMKTTVPPSEKSRADAGSASGDND